MFSLLIDGLFGTQDIATAVEARESGDTETAISTLDNTLAVLKASSETGSPEVQALIVDAESVREEVSEESVS